MWGFEGSIDVTCMQCENEFELNVVDLSTECIYSHERKMGTENTYQLSEIFNCNCGNEIFVNFEAYEYPSCSLNSISNCSSGGECSGDIELVHSDESIILLPDNDLIIPNSTIIELNQVIPNLIKLIQEDNSKIYKISPREFEEIIAELFRNRGFEVELTKQTRDGGKDIIAISTDSMGFKNKYFIECKRYSPNNKVDVAIVRTVFGVHSAYSPNKSIIATTSTFTSDALIFAQKESRSKWQMDLKDINDILGWISQYTPTPPLIF